MRNQPPIPGLEVLVEASTHASEKQATFREQLKSLQHRVLSLELEVSLLRILLEKGGKTSEMP